MGSRQLIAVSDTGPLIHLAEIGSLFLLSIFEELHVPDAVWTEAQKPPAIRQQLTHAKRHSLVAEEVAKFVSDKGLQNLHTGERETLYLGTTLGVPLLLTDDLAVRDAAHKLGLTPVGSIGIVAKACSLRRISVGEADRHLTALYEVSSLYVTRAIVELAREQLGEVLSS